MFKLQLDIQFFNGEKTEKATPKKREDTRKKGQVAKSADLNTAFILLLTFLFIKIFGETIVSETSSFFKEFFSHYLLLDPANDNLKNVVMLVGQVFLVVLGPIFLLCFLASIVINYFQVGFMITTEPLTPKLSKINPIEGFKRIFSLRAIVDLVKSLLKIVCVGAVAFMVLYSGFDSLIGLSQKPLEQSYEVILNLATNVGLYGAGTLLILSVFDYMYQRYDFEKNIRMSKQDIKDEYKKTEGDPLIKSKIKQRQREAAMRRMMAEVPKADVVITNPTHYAIALKYDENISDAPIVVAKGVDYMALKIRKIATENQVTLIENRPLARALYDQAEINQQIPEEFFKAVAEILAYVYRLKNKNVQ